MAEVSRIFVYPIKSCRGIEVEAAEVEARGLEGDRRYMLVDANGRFLTQRRYPQMAQIHVSLDADGYIVESGGRKPLKLPRSMSVDDPDAGGSCQVRIWSETVEACLADAETNIWFSELMGFACGLVHMSDDLHRPVLHEPAQFDDEVSFADGAPLLLLSEASLDDLNTRLQRPVTIRHFRPNLVVTADAAYAEDGWSRIEVGEAAFDVAWPCSRCILTTVDPETGERAEDGEPMATLKTYRQRDRSVYLGQNLLPRRLGRIARGDSVGIQ